jgi:hypothetical protein
LSDETFERTRPKPRGSRAPEPEQRPEPQAAPAAADTLEGLSGAGADHLYEQPVDRRRRNRRPFGSRDQKLYWPAIPNHHIHIFNDEPGRLLQAQEAGYDFVEDIDGKKISFVVGTGRSGGPLIGYLMKIPQDWYEEDMAALQEEIDRTDRAIRRGQVSGSSNPADRDAFYARNIKYETGTGARA